MPMLKMKREDFGFSLLPPAWYPAEIHKVEIKPKKDKPGDNLVITFKGSPEPGYAIPPEAAEGFSNRSWKRYIGMDNIYWLSPILKAAYPEQDFDNMEESEIEIDPEKLIGKRMAVYLEQQEYNGRMSNSLADFAPLSMHKED